MNKKFTVKFGNIEHGWYPIFISVGDTFVEIDASDVPVDPVNQLINALERCFIRGESSEAWMHLEPDYYKWHFSPKDQNVKFKLYYVEEFRPNAILGNKEQRETLKLEFEGDFEEVLFPIFSGLKELASKESIYQKSLMEIESKIIFE